MTKLILFCVMMLSSINVMSQNSAKKLNESQALEQLSKTLDIREIDQNKLAWTGEDIYGYYENGIPIYGLTGILKNEIISNHLSNEDLIFIEYQYKSSDSKWMNSNSNLEILDSLSVAKIIVHSVKTHEMKSYYHSLSKPLYSLNKKFMLIKIYKYCGFSCSHQCIYFFKKSGTKWKEIDKWQCLST